jgi:serine/threonine protein kinase
MAPEVVKQTSYTAKADIWSLGCLIVEMFTGQHPWMELTQMQAIFKIGSSKDARPKIPDGITTEGQQFLDLTFHMLVLPLSTNRRLTNNGLTGITTNGLLPGSFSSMHLSQRTWRCEE